MGKFREKKRLYMAAAAAAAVVAVIVLVTVLILGGREETYRSIRIVELEGSVTIDRESVGSLEASVNMNLVSGDHVSTSAGAYVVLRLDDDKFVMLGEQGAMQVEAEGDASKGRTAIHLEAGSVLSEIQNPLGQNSTYEVVTPSATMSVRGTVFEVRWNGSDSDGSIEVLVYEGKVAVDIEGQEPVLYGGGEYTQFTAGDTPQFLEERSAIKPEQMSSQMLQRLQQIEENGRSLDFGEADLEELIGQKDSDSKTLVADNSQTQESAGKDNLSRPETQDPETAVPSPNVTATEAPASTVRPQSSSTPTPAVTPGPSAAPSPAEKPKSSTTPTPAATSKPTTTQSPTPSEDTKSSESPKEKWTVTFYIPVIESGDGDNIVHFYGSDGPDSLVPYDQQEVVDGSKIAGPKTPKFSDANASDNLIFAGWFTEQNKKWNVDDPVKDDMKLYAVWYIKEHENDNSYYYYPVILDDPNSSYYRCRSVRAGSYLFDQPENSEIYESKDNKDNGCPKSADHDKLAWRVANSDNVFWKRTQTVQGVTSLVADWR